MEIDKLFKHKLAERKVNADSNLFDNISNRFDNASTSKTSLSKIIISSMAVIGIIVVVFLINKTDNSNNNKSNQSTIPHTSKKNTALVNNKASTLTKSAIIKSSNNIPTTSIITDFSDQINISVNNISIEFDKPQIKNNTTDLSDYNTTLDHLAVSNTEEQNVESDDVEYNAPKDINVINHFSNLQIPKYVTPNNDGINDFFVIGNLDLYPNNILVIYNHSGKQIFSQSYYQNNWNAQNLPQGIYMYKLILIIDGEKEIKTGVVEVKF
ncbi:MAG: gliding motility-associated C-terminal domain-containing protein [Bacteroidales bacterium]|jgi:gliding motility-associated-like protein|nr:gliding motility-associated C-terminal domain-containing protein [Bacteroidales bacterium]